MTDPWWKPVLTDSAWCDQMRRDYPESVNNSDDELRVEFADGCKYAVTWDHVGDAYAQFEELADAYMATQPEKRHQLTQPDVECHDQTKQ